MERAWDVLIDIERWPEWTASMTRLEPLDDGDLRAGSRVRITQPKLPKVVWTVTAVEPRTYFEWQSKRPLITSVAGHRLDPEREGCRLTLTLEQTGLLAPAINLFYGKLTGRYMDMEAQGLKARAEGAR
ncbi:MAG TPA: SRPBCC family protein [Dehalococcoidia bacterium]|nr:SRPBCC family protein [Dehalococcoidia bacterium]